MKPARWHIFTYLLIICIFLLNETPLFGQNAPAFNEISYLTNASGVGIRSLAMGGAVIAHVTDYSASYWNPGGLAFARSPEIYGAFSNIIVNNDAEFINSLTSSRQGFTKFNALGIMYPVQTYRGGLTFAVGYNHVEDYNSVITFGGFNDTPDNSVYQSENTYEEGSLNSLTFSGGFQADKGLGIGAAVTIMHGEHIYNTYFSEEDDQDIYTFDVYNEDRFVKSNINGFELKLGMQYLVNKYLNIGTVVTFPKRFYIEDEHEKSTKLTYDSDINAEPENTYDSGVFKYRVSLPFTFGLGASLHFSGVTISGDVEYRDLSQVRYLTDTPLDGLSEGEANRQIRSTIESVIIKRLGVEFPVPGKSLKLRAGYFENPSPLKYSVRENVRKYFTAGVGIKMSRKLEFNAAYLRGWWKESSVDDLISIPVEESKTEDKVYLGISVNF
ncbi:hypothetical protein KAS50_00745 [bacterium]|nr:hypothetical protein [bacterium]